MDATVKTIEVLGPGCARCQETFRVCSTLSSRPG